jgi:hypothetical protein
MSRLCVKSALVVLLLVTSLWRARCDEPSYRAGIAAARNRYLALGNRKALGSALSAAEEKERQCLLGQLIDQDPVFALTREIVAEAQALELGSDTPEERATIKKLTELWQITTQFEGRATELGEAKSFANALRKFVARRDVDGARSWAKAQ